MDICLPELGQIEVELPAAPTETTSAERWIVLWISKDEPEESRRATHELCAALPMVTTAEARLN